MDFQETRISWRSFLNKARTLERMKKEIQLNDE